MLRGWTDATIGRMASPKYAVIKFVRQTVTESPRTHSGAETSITWGSRLTQTVLNTQYRPAAIHPQSRLRRKRAPIPQRLRPAAARRVIRGKGPRCRRRTAETRGAFGSRGRELCRAASGNGLPARREPRAASPDRALRAARRCRLSPAAADERGERRGS